MTGRGRLGALSLGLLVVLSGPAAADCAAPGLTTSTGSVIAGDQVEVTGTVLGTGSCDDTPGCLETDSQQRAAGAELRLLGPRTVDLGEFEPDQDWRRTRRVTVPDSAPAGRYRLAVVTAGDDVLVEAPLVVLSPALRTAEPEPTPYAVPTTAGSPQVQPQASVPVSDDGLSIPWRLRAVLDRSSELVIQVDPGCTQDTTVEVDESDTAVLVRVTAPPTVTTCAIRQYLRIRLDQPLGDRRLLHAEVDPPA